jgi:hypothetical protein
MISAIQHALLGLAIAALAGAALRVASLTGARGLDRVLAALPLAAAAAVGEGLLLGLARLGTSPVALTLAAGATWPRARTRLPAPSPRPLDELRGWWGGLGPAGRALVGALAGVLVAQTAFLLRFPAIGEDGLTYHLADVAGWVQNGRPGSVIDYFDDLPTGSYPITNEVLLSWPVGISRGLVPITLWPVASLAMLCVAGWRGLRLLELPAWIAALAVTALVASPLVIPQAAGPFTDLPATAWLVVAAALCAGVRSHPALLAPAIVAAGLAVGTKTTALAPVVAALAVAAFVARRDLRSLAGPLALAALVALLVGGTWFVRNLIVHGSPLWPLVATPFGDPVPPVLGEVDGRLIADLGSLGERGEAYLATGGTIVLLAGAALAPLLARRREVALASAIAMLCVLIWASAPYTGFPRGPLFDSLAVGATRYLIPGLVAATLALALAARRRGPGAAIAVLLLAGAVVWNLERDLALGFPYLPSARFLLAGLVAGAAVGGLAGALARPSPPPRWALPVAAAAASALLALPASGYVDRHMRVGQFAFDYGRWIADRESYADTERAISWVGAVNAALAGDHLRHPVRLLPRRESCTRLLERVGEEWVVVPLDPVEAAVEVPPASGRRLERIQRCLAATQPVYVGAAHAVYGPPR